MRLFRKRSAVSNVGAIGVVVVVVLAIFAFGFVFLQPGSVNNPFSKTTTSNTQTTVGSNADCSQGASIKSLLATYNSASATSATVDIYQNGSPIINDPGSVTAGTQTSGTANPYSTPFSAMFNASGFYPTTLTTPTTIPSSGYSTQDSLGNTVGSVLCNIPSGSQTNSVPYYSLTGKIFAAPASGTSANTNVESVLNSQNSQTNSFPTAFPTSAPQSQTAYLQLFSAGTSGMRPVTLFGTSNAIRTDYGGVNGVPVTSTQYKNGNPIYYQGYMIAVFNQSAISFSGPSGTTPLTVHGTSGVVAWAVPLNACSPSPSSAVSTSNPYICQAVTFSVQENVAATGHHIDMVLMFVDNTQLGYIQQYFNSPAVTSFPAAGNSHGIPSGFSGIVPPTSALAPHPLIEDYSAVIASY